MDKEPKKMVNQASGPDPDLKEPKQPNKVLDAKLKDGDNKAAGEAGSDTKRPASQKQKDGATNAAPTTDKKLITDRDKGDLSHAALPKILSEQEKYLLELSDLDRAQYDNLIQKNIKLRGEILEIATQLDNLQGKIDAQYIEDLEDQYDNQEELIDLQTQLDQQEIYLSDITARLNDRRKLVGELLKVSDYQDKENQLVFLKKKLKEMSKEKEALEKILNKQNEDLKENDIEKSKKERVALGN